MQVCSVQRQRKRRELSFLYAEEKVITENAGFILPVMHEIDDRILYLDLDAL